MSKGLVNEFLHAGIRGEWDLGVSANLKTLARVDVNAFAFAYGYQFKGAEAFYFNELIIAKSLFNNIKEWTHKGIGRFAVDTFVLCYVVSKIL